MTYYRLYQMLQNIQLPKLSKRKLLHPFFSLLLLISVTGCGFIELPLLLGIGAVGVGAVLVDRRSTSAQLDDELIEMRAASKIHKDFQKSHINVTSFNRVVLLTGEVASANVRDEIERMVKNVQNVRSIFNQIVIGPVSSGGTRTKDTWITSKVKTSFLVDKNIKSRDIKVVTESGVVYLMGIVTEAEARQAREYAATDISGVKKIVSLFEIARPSQISSSQSNRSSSQTD